MTRKLEQTRNSRPTVRQLVLLGAASVLMAVLISGCGGGSGNASEAAHAGQAGFYTGGVPGGTPRRGGVLTITKGPFTSLDPETIGVGDLGTQENMFDQLLELLPGKSQPQPGVATSWTVSQDGLTYDFKLRTDVRFSNGEPLTAKDVVFTLHRMTTKANETGQFIFPNTFKSITEVGPYEVRFVLNKPVGAMLANLADPACSIFPKNVLAKESRAQFALHPVGSGAFMLKSFSPGKYLELVRNPYYWRAGQPYVDGVTYSMVADTNQRILSVRSGQADIAEHIPYSQINLLRHTSGVVMTVQPQYSVDDVEMNDARAPFTDPKVRQALAYATPVQDIIKAVYHGYAEPANTIMPKMDYWDRSVTYHSYNLAKAKELLAASSVPHGFSTTLIVPGADPDSTELGTILQSAWAKLGVKLTIRQVDPSTQGTDMFEGNYQIGVFETGAFINDVAVPDDAAGLVYDYNSGTHGLATYLNSPRLARLFHQAAETNDESLREKLYREMQTLSQSEAQALPIAFVPAVYLVSSRVRNFTSVGGGWARLDAVYLSS